MSFSFSFIHDHKPVLLTSALRMLPPKGQRLFAAPYLWRYLPPPPNAQWAMPLLMPSLTNGLDLEALEQKTNYEELNCYDWYPQEEPALQARARRQTEIQEWAAEDPER
ncbi:hypothetical protein MMC30_003578 [Trapelia coarctata]|nr:hypothetical protein [Trapelia coarctata]